MFRHLRRLLQRIHDDLAHRVWCDPDHGIVGSCHYHDDPYQRVALGMRPVCITCKRERPRA